MNELQAADSAPLGGLSAIGNRGSALQAPWRRRAVVAPAKKQRGGKGFGGGSAPAPVQDPSDLPAEQSPPQVQQEQQAPAVGGSGSGTGSGGGAGGAPAPRTELPAVGRGRIFAVCAQVSLLVAVAGAGLRQVAPAISPAVGDGQGEAVEALLACESTPLPCQRLQPACRALNNWTLRLPHCFLLHRNPLSRPLCPGATVPGAGGLALAVGVAAAVTAARAALLAAWPEFREASDRSNQQVGAAAGPSVAGWQLPPLLVARRCFLLSLPPAPAHNSHC